MKLMEDRIRRDGIIENGDVLKVGSFLNQQIDVGFVSAASQEFYRLYGNEGVTRILTIEASGIGLACLTALPFGVPVVFAKKSRSSNISGGVYASEVFSFTHGTRHQVIVPTSMLSRNDRVLIIDDIVTTGATLAECSRTLLQAGASDVVYAAFAAPRKQD